MVSKVGTDGEGDIGFAEFVKMYQPLVITAILAMGIVRPRRASVGEHVAVHGDKETCKMTVEKFLPPNVWQIGKTR